MGQPVQPPTQVRWLVFGLACASSWMLYLHRYTWNFIGPELERTHGLSKAELGTLFSFFMPPYGIFQIPSGILSDLVGPHLFLGLIMILWSLSLPLHAAAGSFASLAVVRVLYRIRGKRTRAGAEGHISNVEGGDQSSAQIPNSSSAARS